MIRRIYAEKRPEKLNELDRLMAKYRDREHELYKLVCEKYGVDADEFKTQPVGPFDDVEAGLTEIVDTSDESSVMSFRPRGGLVVDNENFTAPTHPSGLGNFNVSGGESSSA